MRKVLAVGLVLVLACSFVLIGKGSADAMNNEAAAMLAGAIAIVGGAAIHAATVNAYYPEPVYVETYPTSYYRERTVIVHEYPRYRNFHRPYRGAYERGWSEHARRRY